MGAKFTVEDISAEEIAARALRTAGLLGARDLVDATIRTRRTRDRSPRSRPTSTPAVARLRSTQIDGAFGVRRTTSGESIGWGNAVIGIRNALAPPLEVRHEPDGRRWADFHLGRGLRGPAGTRPRRVSALILDHVLGEAASGPQTAVHRQHHHALPARHPLGHCTPRRRSPAPTG